MGVLIFGPIMHSLIDVIGWRKTFLVLGGIMLLPILLAITFSNNVKKAEEIATELNNRHIPSLDVPLYRNQIFVVITISACICMFGEYIPQVHIVSTRI